MKNKIVSAVLSLFSLLLFSSCSSGRTTDLTPASSSYPAAEGKELLCFADTKEQAQEIADIYGIELVEYTESASLACFHTEEKDLRKIIQNGIDQGWPELSVNSISHLSSAD